MGVFRKKLFSSYAENEIGEDKDNDEGYSGKENNQREVRVFLCAKSRATNRVFHDTLDAIRPHEVEDWAICSGKTG